MTQTPATRIARGLRAFTPARVGLGRTGVSQQTQDVLQFQQAHAAARNAVHAKLNAHALAAAVAEMIAGAIAPAPLLLHSAAHNRTEYLQRPDLGRALDPHSREALLQCAHPSGHLALVLADGLSAIALERHAVPLLQTLLPQLNGWTIAPVCIVEQGRVAIGDEIGEILGAQIAVVLIGERPGLSSPDSLGAYVTWMPRPGRTDAERVCISNIRSEGLTSAEAAAQLHSALVQARRARFTGVRSHLESPALGQGDSQ